MLSKVFADPKNDYFVRLYELWGKIQKQLQIKQNVISVLLAYADSVQFKKKKLKKMQAVHRRVATLLNAGTR